MDVDKELFKKAFNRRLLVRLLGIRFTNLIPGTYQINSFEDSEEMIKLYQQIDSIKRRFGGGVLSRANAQLKTVNNS